MTKNETAPAPDVTSRWLGIVAAYALLHALAWAILPLAIHAVQPADNYEQLRWAQHLAWGYDKHPPFPTILLWLFERVFPAGIPLTYALGGLQVITMLVATWWITRPLLDGKRALLAVLFVSCVTYYANRLHYYNHNTALLMACALSAACAFKAAQTGKWTWYSLLGIAWGLGLLSKYQMVIAIACDLIFLWWVAGHELRKLIARLTIASCACALVVAPHFFWLVDNHFPSFQYAAKFVAANLPWGRRPADIVGFLLDQALRFGPLGGLLLILGRFKSVRAAAARALPARDASPLAAPFLAIHAWGPLALMSSLSLLFGTNLQMHWGTAFIWTIPIWFLRTPFGKAVATLPMRTLFIAVVFLQFVMLFVFAERGASRLFGF